MKVSQNFISEEFLSEEFHNYVLSKGWQPIWWIDKDLVMFCEWLKAQCNNATIIINDWKWGGQYNYSGYRSPTDIGAEYSQHKCKAALDIKVKGYTPAQLKNIIINNFIYLNKVFGITTIEKTEYTETWLHVDKRWTGLNYLKQVTP